VSAVDEGSWTRLVSAMLGETAYPATGEELERVATPRFVRSNVQPLVLRQQLLLRKAMLYPRWREPDFDPHGQIEPAPALADPVDVGDFRLWPDDQGGRAFFSLTRPRVLDFSVVVQREVSEGTIKTTGGTATLTLSAYPVVETETLVALHEGWATALVQAGHPAQTWQFQVLNLRNVEASVSLDADHLVREPQITASGEFGLATYVLELSSLGAQIWKDAIERHTASAIPGACALRTHYYAQLRDRLEVREQTLTGSIGSLLGSCGPEVLHVLNPEVTFESRVIVGGHPTIAETIVSWLPSEGHNPETIVFDEFGGQFAARITSQNPKAVTIDWNAQVRFRPAGWPVVSQSGTLSVQDKQLSVVLKPDTWLVDYTISVVLLDANGNVIEDADFSDPQTRVQAVLAYQAPFIGGGQLRSTLFEGSNQHIVNVAFPQPPDSPPGTTKLTVFATRGESLRQVKRLLKRSESLVAVIVHPDARVEIVTENDPVPELSDESSVLARLAALHPATANGAG
jgi:hypothetical protein